MTEAMTEGFDGLEFRHPFRKYQQMILDQVEAGVATPPYHIVSPPGSGKTIVGLELIRRFGAPAVVFAPTTTIQQQWRERFGMFAADPDEAIARTSSDPHDLAAVNVFTYQLISTPAQSGERLAHAARQDWVDELVREARVETPGQAVGRIDTLAQHNRYRYRRELRRRQVRIRRGLLRDPDADVAAHLHVNARDLIERLVGHGVTTVVLDECHHLLDYWAIVLRHLIDRIRQTHGDAAVVGLTATLPSPDGDREYDNYMSLLGEVDFEVPTPAVVKEGNLAPYRDLAVFVRPSGREQAFLDDLQAAFEDAVTGLLDGTGFADWVAQELWGSGDPHAAAEAVDAHAAAGTADGEAPADTDAEQAAAEAADAEADAEPADDQADAAPPEQADAAPPEQADAAPAGEAVTPAARWAQLLRGDAPFAIAAARFCTWNDQPPPPGVPLPPEADEDLRLDDWGFLLERYGLRVLAVSADETDHERLQELRRVLRGFGLTLTERGLRQSRSAGDLVLAFSESKDPAVAEILAREHTEVGDGLRAIVVTDFERMSSAVRGVDALADDAGSALRVFRHLVHDPRTHALDPVLVTGRRIKAGADWAEELVTFFNEDLARRGFDARCRVVETEREGIVEIAGSGAGWSSASYVLMVTDAFGQGLVRCMVGTRGIFGEGWDSLALNTLVDLTSVTTSTSVQQLRGRSIRLDPTWSRKVAHNWDVVCVAPTHERGDRDLRRFVQRHSRYWGITAPRRAGHLLADAERVLDAGLSPEGVPLAPETDGRITRGVIHVDEQLAAELAFRPLRRVGFRRATRRAYESISRRDGVYDWWRVGEDYANFAFSATRLTPEDLKFRTVHTVRDTVKRMLRQLRAGLAAGALLVAYTLVLTLTDAWAGGVVGSELAWTGFGVLALGTVVTLGANARPAARIARMLRDQPPDAILADTARAVLAGLREAGLVSRHLQDHYVRVTERDDGTYEVLLDYADTRDAQTFTAAYGQVFAPVRDQRYLIERSDGRLPDLGTTVVWLALRWWARRTGYPPAYHPVPDVLAVNRGRADAFARHWREQVGGGQLVYTRSEEGWRTLVAARAQRRPDVRSLVFDLWR